MAEAPAVSPLGAATLNRDWRVEVDSSGQAGQALPAMTTTNASSTITTPTPHGLAVGQQITLTTIQAPAVAGTTYFVAAVLSATTFTISATAGGAAISFTAAGGMTGTKGPLWVVVRGRTDSQPGVDNTLQEDSDMDSGGWKSQTKTAQAWTLQLKVVRKAVQGTLSSGSTATYDPGQEVLRLAGDQVGPYNSVFVRWYKLGAVRTEAYQGYGAVGWSPDGGGMDDLDKATVTITGQGPRVAITHPYTLP